MKLPYKIGINLLLSLATGLLALKVLDVMLGPPPTAHPDPYAFSQGLGRSVVLREIQPNLNTSVEPSSSAVAEADKLDPSPRALHTDANGFVVESDKGADRSPETPKILFFGGSTTECLYADPLKRFPAAVGQLLQNEKGEKVTTLNAGVSGSHTLHMVISLLAKGIPEKPQVAVLMENINDLVTLSRSGSYWDGPSSRQILQPPISKPDPSKKKFQRWLQATARLLYNNISERAILAFPRLSQIIDPDREKEASQDEWESMRDVQPIDQSQILSEFRSSLLSFIRLCRSWNIEPVLMTQFNRLASDDDFIRKSYESKGIDYDDFCRRYSEFNGIIRTTAAEEHCLLIDLAQTVFPSKDYLYDSVHLNEKGCQLVANQIAFALAAAFPDLHLVDDSAGEPPRDSGGNGL